jgi:uncharacterized protein YlxW (UPF0749 family)
MSKYKSQLIVSLVCCILGFMLAYQFRILNKNAGVSKVKETNTDITVELEQYKNQKAELQKNIDELQKKVSSYEEAAASKSSETKNLLEEVKNTRLLMGAETVQGTGITIYLNPKTKMLQNDVTNDQITDKHLVYLVNELISAGAEAISINDIRITPRTGIRTSGANIRINEENVSPQQRITIKAIGNKNLLNSAMSFPGVFNDFKAISDYKYETSDNITINKYNYGKSLKFDYAKPVK